MIKLQARYKQRTIISCETIKKGGNIVKDNNYMMYAEDISKELGISKGYAYKIIKELNQELKEAGFIVISGRVPRAFWETKFYGNGTQIETVQ